MKINTPERVKNFDNPSVWLEFSPLSQMCDSVNLGQGFPDWSPPKFLQDYAIDSVQGNLTSRYSRSAGHPLLVNEIASQYSMKLGRDLDPNQEILVTVGASEALFLSIMSFLGPDDEVIIIEPAFDIYLGQLEMAQANIKTVKLLQVSKDGQKTFELDYDQFKKTINSKTKALILNSPHNPTGKVFSKEELIKLAEILEEYPDCLVISDEVYEHLTFDDHSHTPIASLSGMFNRTLSIYSSGKTFATTGWKIGWIIGDKKLIKRLQVSQQWVCFSVATPLQEAIAHGLKKAIEPFNGFESYFKWLQNEYRIKKDLLFSGLKKAGFNPIKPQGSFFILCDIKDHEFSFDSKKYFNDSSLSIDRNTLELRDYNYCRYLSINKKVTAIPTSAFYLPEHKNQAQNFLRFAFCKDNQILNLAIKNLMTQR